jgi:hypothetical protein
MANLPVELAGGEEGRFVTIGAQRGLEPTVQRRETGYFSVGTDRSLSKIEEIELEIANVSKQIVDLESAQLERRFSMVDDEIAYCGAMPGPAWTGQDRPGPARTGQDRPHRS